MSGPGATVETSLFFLEQNAIAIDGRITKETEEAFQKITDKLKREEQSRLEGDTELADAVTDGVRLTRIGASWLFVGVILSTASVDIEALLWRLPMLHCLS